MPVYTSRLAWDAMTQGYTLKSGRLVRANRGIVGLGPDATDPTEGYDGGLNVNDDDEPWTDAERAELALEMMRRWLWFGTGGR